MDGVIGYAGTNDLASYSQLTYTAPYMITQSAPYVTNVSASCGTSETHNSASHFHSVHSRTCENLTGAHVPSSSTDAYEFDDWKEKRVAYFKRANAIYLEYERKPHDPAAIQAYESYKKEREEEREQFKINFYSSQSQSFGNARPKETKNIGGGNHALQRIAPKNSLRRLLRNY